MSPTPQQFDAFAKLMAPLETAPGEWPSTLLHYTTAHCIHQIISTRRLGLSAASAMNDADEVHAGLSILGKWSTTCEYRNWQIEMNRDWPEFLPSFGMYFNSLVQQSVGELFLSCWCEAEDAHPDGKLSMWRAYGADGRGNVVAIKTGPLLNGRKQTSVPVQLFKTRYESDLQFVATLQRISDAFLGSVDLAKQIAEAGALSDAHWLLAQAWFFAALTRKHPGFSEEREWRFIYNKAWDADAVLRNQVQVAAVGAQLRQRVLLEIRDYTDMGMPGTALDEILEFVIVGPNTMDKISAFKALEALLSASGVSNAASKVRICATPYRTTF